MTLTKTSYQLNGIIRRCFASLPSSRILNHTCLTVPDFSEKSRGSSPRKSNIQPRHLTLFILKYNHPVLQNSDAQLRHYSTFLYKTRCHNTFQCIYLNSHLKITPQLNGIVLRGYHQLAKFSLKNPVFSFYLESLVKEYDDLCGSEHSNDSTQLQQQQMLRLNFLKPVVEVIKKIQEKYSEVQELVAATEGEEDQEMKKMMEKEIEKYNQVIGQMEEELVNVLVGEDPADHSNIVLEVSPGVGGQEAMLFASDIVNMYYSYAHYKGWTISGLATDMSELGGMRRGTFEISGEDVYKHLKHEVGVHRVQRVPKTEKAGRVHTSTITVTVLPQPREIDIDIQQKDLKIECFRCSGPGGQSVNTTDSAVRIIHIPTGTVSECRQERSQIKNKELALKNLKHRIYQNILEQEEAKRRTTRKMQMGTRARSEKIRTYNFPQDRVTDHRLKESLSDLAVFMTGGEKLDMLIDSLADMEKVQILDSMLEEFEMEAAKKKSDKS